MPNAWSQASTPAYALPCLQKESSPLTPNQSRFDLFKVQLKLAFDLDSFLAQRSYYLSLTYLTIWRLLLQFTHESYLASMILFARV